MKKQKRKIVVDEYTSISSVWLIPDDFRAGETDALILAHGAGQGMNSPFMTYFHQEMARRGLLSIKFDFEYMEQGRRVPDPQPKLRQRYRDVIDAVATKFAPRRKSSRTPRAMSSTAWIPSSGR